jgi:tyrosine-protein kinase Etk/Wzc
MQIILNNIGEQSGYGEGAYGYGYGYGYSYGYGYGYGYGSDGYLEDRNGKKR